MPFPANQVMNYFHVFILMLMAICLAYPRNGLKLWTSVSSLQLVSCFVSGHVSFVPQQFNSRQNGKFCGHRVKSLFGSLMLSSVHSTIIIINAFINQAGSYYIITNFYLIRDRSQLYSVTRMMSLLLHSTLAPLWSRVITKISSL